MASLVDGKPKITVAATDPMQHLYAQTMQSAVDAVWFRRKVGKKVEQAQKNALIYGVGYLKVYWDTSLEQGRGDIQVAVVPSEQLYVDPQATDFEDAEYILEVKVVPMSYIKRHYPERAHLVRPDAPVQSTFRGGENRFGMGVGGYSDPTTPLRWFSPTGDNPLVADQTEFSNPPYRPSYDRDDDVTLIECWTRDYSTHTIPTITPIGIDPWGRPMTTVREVEVPKYPYGRVIHIAGGVTVEDKPAPYQLPNTVGPYVKFSDIDRPGEFFGLGEPQLLEDIQMELNKRRSQMIDHANLMGNSIWVVDKMSGVDVEKLTNRPGLIIEKNSGTEVRRESAPSLPNWILQSIEMCIRDMREISGVSGIPGGQPPKGVRSGSGFEAAQSIGNVRIRAIRGRNMEMSLESLGRLFVALIQQFYTTPRLVRIVGNAGMVAFVPFDGRQVRGDWDIHIQSGTAAAGTQQARASQAVNMAQAGLIDRRAALEVMEWPGTEEICRRMGDQFMEQAQQYPGWPGPVNRNAPSASSGYATSIRGMAAPPQPQQNQQPLIPQQGGQVGQPPSQGGGQRGGGPGRR